MTKISKKAVAAVCAGLLLLAGAAFAENNAEPAETAETQSAATLTDADAVLAAQKAYEGYTFKYKKTTKPFDVEFYKLKGKNGEEKMTVYVNTVDGTVLTEEGYAQYKIDTEVQALGTVEVTVEQAATLCAEACEGYTFTLDKVTTAAGDNYYKMEGTANDGSTKTRYVNVQNGTVLKKSKYQILKSADEIAAAGIQDGISEEDAIKAAQTQYPAYTFEFKKTVEKKGEMFYKLKGTDANGENKTVYVSIASGEIRPSKD